MKGIKKEKFLTQGTVQKEARNEARQQFKREFQRLKTLVIKQCSASLQTQKEKEKSSNNIQTSHKSTCTSSDNTDDKNTKRKEDNYKQNNEQKYKKQRKNQPKETTPKKSTTSDAPTIEEINKQVKFVPKLKNNEESNSNRTGCTSCSSDQKRCHKEDCRNRYQENHPLDYHQDYQYQDLPRRAIRWRDEEYFPQRHPERFEEDGHINRYRGRGRLNQMRRH